MEKKTKHPIIAMAFTCLVVLTLPAGIFAGLLAYFAIVGGIGDLQGFTWFRSAEEYYALDSTSPRSDLIGLTMAGYAALYLLAWLLRVGSGLKRFPFSRLLLLNMSLALCLGFATAGLANILLGSAAGGLIGVVIGLVAALFVTWAAFFAEKIFCRALAAFSRKLYAGERYGMADAAVGLAIRLRPASNELHRILGLSLYAKKRYEPALENLEILYFDDTEDIEVLDALDKCYQAAGNNERALATEKRLLALEPERIETRLEAASILNSMGQTKEAVDLLRKPSEPNMELLIVRLGYEMASDNRKQAIQTCKRIETMDEGSQQQALAAWNRVVETWPDSEEALESLGELYLQHRREDEGYRLFEKIIVLDPHRHELRKRLVQHYKQKNRMAQAEPHLTALMDAGSDNVEIALLYGDLLVQREDYDSALLHFQYAVENYPDDYRFAYFLAQIHLRSGALEDAKHWAEVALKTAPGSDHPGQTRIKRLLKKTEDTLAEREMDLWRDRCNRQPHNLEMRYGYIAALIKNNQNDRAVGEASTLLDKHPEQQERLIAEIEKSIPDSERNYRLLDFLAELKLKSGQYDEVFGLAKRMGKKSMNEQEVMQDYCDRILSRNDQHAASLTYLLRDAEEKKDWQKSYDLTQRLLLANPSQEKIYRQKLYRAAANLGYVEKTLEHAEAFLKFEPNNMKFRLDLAEFLISQSLFTEALEQIDMAATQDFYDAEVARLKEELLKKKSQEKMKELEERIKNNPSDTKAQLELGDALSLHGQYREAIPHFQRAAQDTKSRDLALTKVAYSMAMIGMLDLAEETLSDVSLLIDNPEDAETAKGHVYDIGLMLEEHEEMQRALKIYKAIFRVDAGFRDVVDKMERLNI